MFDTSVTIDTSGLNRALDLAQKWTRSTPAKACNYAGRQVAFEAQKMTPKVTVPTIDTELAIIKPPVIGKRGKPLKKKMFMAQPGGDARNMQGIPLAILVIQARANLMSNYNFRTNARYAGPSPFKGVSRASGQAAMALAVHKMIANRHKSIAFLRAGWTPAIKTLGKYVSGNLDLPIDLDVLTPENDKLGEAIPAKEGSTRAACTIANEIGYTGQNKASFDRALQQYGGPALQTAVDIQGVKEMNYFLAKEYNVMLVIPFNKLTS